MRIYGARLFGARCCLLGLSQAQVYGFTILTRVVRMADLSRAAQQSCLGQMMPRKISWSASLPCIKLPASPVMTIAEVVVRMFSPRSTA